MRVLFTSIRGTGHFQPLVPFLTACRERGHDVAVAGPEDLSDRVAKTGAAFFPFGHPGDAALRPIWERVRSAPREEANRIVVSEIFAGRIASAAVPLLLETIERFRPSILVRESQEYGALLAAEQRSIPHARVSISLTELETRLRPIAAGALDRHRQELGLGAARAEERLRNEAVLTLFPRCFDSDVAGSSPARRFRTRTSVRSALPEWWKDASQPLVYLTLGTVAAGMDAARAAYRTLLDAVEGLPVRALLTTGGDLAPEVLGAAPANVHVERFVPQDDVLAHAALIVCHGGSGTVLGALAKGVPLVVTPLFADQHANAARVAELGAGVAVDLKTASARELSEAIQRVLREPAFRAAARRVQSDIASLPLVDEAAGELERIAKG